MAATPLSDDGVTVAYQLDNGQVVNVPRDAAIRAGAPLPASSSAAPAIPAMTPGMGAPPPSTPNLGAPLDMSKAQGIPPPPTPSGNVYDEQTPPAQPGIVPARADDAMFAGKNATAVPAGGPGAMPPPAKPGAPMPAKPGAPAAPGTPGRFGAIVDEGNQAAAMQQQAIDERSTVDKAANDQIAKTFADRNVALEAQRQKQLADAKASADEIERRGKTIDAAIADYAKTKIDPNRMWNGLSGGGKAGLIFAQVLSGLGQALKHKGGENPAIDMWLKQTQQDVQLQMADLEKQRGVIDMNKGALATFKDLAATKQGVFALAMAGETDRAAKSLEQIAAQTKSDLVKSNALEASAVLKQQSATFKGEWAKTEFTSDLQAKAQAEEVRSHKASEGVAYGHLALARDQFTEGKRQFDLSKMEGIREFELNRQDRLNEKADELALKGQSAMAGQAKELRELGIGDPTSGDSLLVPEAKPYLSQADLLERQANAQKDPVAAKKMLDAAKNIRDQVSVQFGWKAPDAESARALRTQVAAAQSMTDITTKVIRGLDDDPSAFDRDKWAALKSEWSQAKAAYGKAHGGRLSEKEFEVLDDIFGGDPGDMTTRVAGKDKLKAALTSVRDATVLDTQTDLRAAGYRGEWKPAVGEFDKTVDPFTAPTTQEKADAAEPGLLGKGMRGVLNPTGYKEGGFWDPAGAEVEGSKSTSGLDPKAAATVESQMKLWSQGTQKERAQISARFRDLANSSRESVGAGVLNILRGNPDLYKEVVSSLPADKQKLITASDAALSRVTTGRTEDPVAQASMIFKTRTPDQIAQLAVKDRAVAEMVKDRALNGLPDEQRKAAAVIAKSAKWSPRSAISPEPVR